MLLGNLKNKTHKIHMNIGQSKYFKNMFIKEFFFEKKEKSISKGLLKIRFNFDLSKITII